MKCPKCNAVVEDASRFCGRCGQMIEKPAAVPLAAQVQPALAAAIPAIGIANDTAARQGSSAGPAAASVGPMSRLIERIKNLILAPKLEWQVIAPEPTTVAQLYTGYIMPLAAFAAVMSFLHVSLVGVSVPLAGMVREPVAAGLKSAICSFGFGLLGTFLVALFIDALASTFAGSRDRRQALKVTAYSFTPAWLSSILALSPVLPALLQWVALFYGIYVLYLGLPVLMRSPPERALGYTATVVAGTLLLGFVLLGLSVAVGHFGGGTASLSSSPAAQAAAQDRGATTVGNIIGNALGTDDKGKAGLGTALSNLVKAGQSSGAPSPGTSAATSNTPDAQANSTASEAPAQNPASALGGLVTALGGALGGSHRVTPVDFKSLTAMLPASLPGMKRTDAEGEKQGAVGVTTTSAKADYQGNDGADVHIEISDISGVSGLMDAAGSLVQNTTSESASGFERDRVIGGRSVHEKFDARAKKGDLNVILAKRFEVDVTGEGVDMNTLEQSLGQVDLARLESMKDQGAQAQ
jgi:hypothetical protein